MIVIVCVIVTVESKRVELHNSPVKSVMHAEGGNLFLNTESDSDLSLQKFKK